MKRSAFKEINSTQRFARQILKGDRRLKYLNYRFAWNFFPKLKYVAKFPTHVDIEITNKCNLRCVMCPHGFPTAEFRKSLGSMDPELAKKVIDEGCKKGLASIKVNWRGEPLIWKKNMRKLISYAKKKGIVDIMMNTNGLLLNNEFSKELIASGLDQISFSVDGTSSKTYESIRQGGNYFNAIGNIERFINIRNDMKRIKPLVRVQMVKQNDNIHEVDAFIKKWTSLVDSITFQDYTNRGETTGRLNETKDGYHTVGRRACPQIWQRIVVTWDGKVVMCCRDWNSENVLGELDYSRGRDLESFWSGKKLKKIRRLHLRRDVDKITACAKCTYKESFRWKKLK